MKTIHVRTRIDSDTLHLPELRDLIGKPVEVFIVELQPVDRAEVFAEASHTPDTPAEAAAQQAKFRAWMHDPRYEHLWPMIEKLIDPNPPATGNGTATAHRSASA